MKKTQPLSFDVDHTFTIRDHSDMHTTSSTPEVVVSAWEGNIAVTVRSKDDPKIVYGEVYLELYAGELAVNVYDEEHYGGEGDRFTLSRFNLDNDQDGEECEASREERGRDAEAA